MEPSNHLTFVFQLVSSKVQESKLKSNLQQSKASRSDIQKMLIEEQNHAIEMEAEFQNQLLQQEKQHQEKVKHKLEVLRAPMFRVLWFPDLLIKAVVRTC